jgi:hypothetical protein
VLPYPAINTLLELPPLATPCISAIKCLTYVVELGLNNCSVPPKFESLSLSASGLIF